MPVVRHVAEGEDRIETLMKFYNDCHHSEPSYRVRVSERYSDTSNSEIS